MFALSRFFCILVLDIMIFILVNQNNKIMTYLSKERLSEIRKQLKSKYPDFKFGVRKVRSSTAQITFIRGTISLEPGNLNHYYPHNHADGQDLAILKDIIGIVTNDWRIVSEDGDYGFIPNFYVRFEVADNYEKV